MKGVDLSAGLDAEGDVVAFAGPLIVGDDEIDSVADPEQHCRSAGLGRDLMD